MIRNIIELLPYAKGETENIRIAKGKYKIPQTLKEGYKQIKEQLWQRKSI
jgi:hypothetical protein